MNYYMQNIVQWSNENNGFLSIVLSVISIFISVLAIIISVKTTSKQNKISLLQQRIKVLENIEAFCQSLGNWEFDLSRYKKIGKAQIVALFNEEANEQYDSIYLCGKNINVLQGDLEYAKTHDTCKGRTEEQIEKEIQEEVECSRKLFEEFVDDFYKNCVKL